MALGIRGVAALALLAAVLTSVLDGQEPQTATASRDVVPRAAVAVPRGRPPRAAVAVPRGRPPGAAAASRAGGRRACPQVVSATGYVNPLAAAVVKPERIDQGVDYAGSGALTAMGRGRITYVGTSGTGWPGAFVGYRLLDGPDAGCFVFYAEGVVPVPGLRVGEVVGPGQAVATIISDYPTGIEIGWAAGRSTKTYAAAAGQWSPKDDRDNIPTPAGKSFSALISALGGPPGKVEG
jgi:hypothetical protein